MRRNARSAGLNDNPGRKRFDRTLIVDACECFKAGFLCGPRSCPTSKQARVDDWNEGDNRGGKHRRNLGPGEGGDKPPEAAGGKDVKQGSEGQCCKRSPDQDVEDSKRHQHHEYKG